MKHCLLALLLLVPGSAFAKKKPPKEIVITQPDIERGCIVIQGIHFERHMYGNTGLGGQIVNNCGAGKVVTMTFSFFDEYGNLVGSDVIQKLVPESGSPFWGLLAFDSMAAVQAKAGRVMTVLVQ